MEHICFCGCCSDCVGVCRNVFCVVAVCKDSVLALECLKVCCMLHCYPRPLPTLFSYIFLLASLLPSPLLSTPMLHHDPQLYHTLRSLISLFFTHVYSHNDIFPKKTFVNLHPAYVDKYSPAHKSYLYVHWILDFK